MFLYIIVRNVVLPVDAKYSQFNGEQKNWGQSQNWGKEP